MPAIVMDFFGLVIVIIIAVKVWVLVITGRPAGGILEKRINIRKFITYLSPV